MKVKWYGHSSFLITSEQGLKIITDPYEPGGFGGAITYGKIIDTPDIVLISHDHGDHNFIEGIPGSPAVIRKPGTQNIKGIEFLGIPTYHDTSQGKERGKNIVFLFRIAGIKICHLGDLGHQLSREDIEKMGSIDLLLIPIGGTYTINPQVATQIVQGIKPKIAIPMHFKTQKCGFPLNEVKDFTKGKKKFRILGENEMEIKKGNLPSETEIIVMDHAL